MKSWILIGLALAALASGCAREREAGIAVRVTFEPSVLSTHVKVTAAGGSVVRSTPCTAVQGAGLDVGVAQADLPATVLLSAEGFTDAACTVPTDPVENAVPVERRFRAGLILDATLHVRPTRPRIETQCANGLDDDNDGLKDCLDDDCVDRECTTGNACVAGQRCQGRACVGGAQVTCTTAPSSCFVDLGLCVTDAGCRYMPNPGIDCDDGNPCTEMDRCDGTGACGGAVRECRTPPAGQCWVDVGVCSPDAGCVYGPDVGASCDDGENCTVNDACTGDGGCAGTRVTCTPNECQRFTDTCSADGGCVFAPLDAGLACGTGGQCNATGGCLPPFDFVPSNVPLTSVPTPPATKVTLGCGTTTIDTGASGPPVVTNWCTGQPLFGAASVVQAGGVPAVVLAFHDLEVAGGSTLALVGARPAIIVSTGDVTVLGTITVAAGAQACTGAGAGSGGATGLANNSGAGGGGFGSAGGAGGKVAGALGNAGGAAGPVNGVAELTPLRGGCPGGKGASSGERLANGGGALQLVARGTLTLAGVITAPGEGGRGGGFGAGGNGGGSGGAVLLEARRLVASSGGVMANGGGGGEGGTGNDGQAGQASGTPATGGAGLGGPGGDGAAGGTAAEAGSEAIAVGGGGGGGVGRVRINVASDCSLGPTSVVTLSPAPTSNKPDAGCP